MRLASFGLALLLAIAATGGSASGAETFGLAERLADKAPAKRGFSDGAIKKLLIAESVAAYEGNCPCPYSRARNGSRCGKRSAYSREGGEAPLCFDVDVSAGMVQAYRDEHPDE